MEVRMEQNLATNVNSLLSADKHGYVFYSNNADNPLLREWGINVGEKLPPSIGDLVQKVISRNSPEKMEIKVGNRTYLVIFSPLPGQECVNISGFDISDQEESEDEFQKNAALKKDKVELSEILDIQAIKPLMENLHKLVHLPIGINDLKGSVLVGVGWQDICTKFHRVHPEACKHCIESDKELSSGVVPGEFKLYKCKNNMYDIVTPIMVGYQHVGYVFSGQFFFDDEPLDYELFRSQARKYGFNEEEYITALKKVPRLNREVVNTSMSFFRTFANLLSQISYSNLKLAHSLSERNCLLDKLLESEKSERTRSNELAAVLDAVPAAVWIAHDPMAIKMTGNRLSYEWLRLPEGANVSKATPVGERPETYRLFKDGEEIQLADMPVRMSASGKEVRDYEFDVVYLDGTMRHLLGNAKPLCDEHGNPHGSISAFIDITDRKKVEEALKRAHENLEVKIKERTSELERAYSSLKESEERLAEAQRIAHIGNYDNNLVTKELYWSNELYLIFGLEHKASMTYDKFLSFVHPDDRDYVFNSTSESFIGNVYAINYRIIRPDGEERIVHSEREVIFDERKNPIRAKGTIQDITDRIKAEEALVKVEEARRKEIHHRIKNNLQVISSLLDLQAEKFRDKEVLEAFRESQSRVISMSLIHEELYKGEGTDNLDFSAYLQMLAKNLFHTYDLGNKNIRLYMDLAENAFFNMDIAVPLGIIVNELISNSLKHAFKGRDKGEILIRLHREIAEECKIDGHKNTNFTLTVSDDGIGISENLDIKSIDSLGLQLVFSLVDQLDGELELKRDNGTEFTIHFTVMENNNQALEPQLVDN